MFLLLNLNLSSLKLHNCLDKLMSSRFLVKVLRKLRFDYELRFNLIEDNCITWGLSNNLFTQWDSFTELICTCSCTTASCLWGRSCTFGTANPSAVVNAKRYFQNQISQGKWGYIEISSTTDEQSSTWAAAEAETQVLGLMLRPLICVQSIYHSGREPVIFTVY